jgi:protein TonB
VVDTLGRVEAQSIVIREAAHDLFATAVRAVLPALRFRPAEAGGHRVRMLVELPFEFRLDH